MIEVKDYSQKIFNVKSYSRAIVGTWHQGRNQERANRPIDLPEIFANMMAFTYFTWKDFSRNCATST